MALCHPGATPSRGRVLGKRLLAVLGVDLIMIVVLLGVMLTRRRWVSHQPGALKGAIRVVDGEVPGLGPKWKRGYGRWVRDVLVLSGLLESLDDQAIAQSSSIRSKSGPP